MKQAALRTSFIAVIIALVAGLILIRLFVMGSQPGKDFIQSCQIGQCYKDTPRCTPDQPISQGTCKAEINDETRSGTCYSSWDAPDDCLITPDAQTDSEDANDDNTEDLGNDETDDDNQDNQDTEDGEETTTENVLIEVRRGESTEPVRNGQNIDVYNSTRVEAWSRGGENIDCELRVLNKNGQQVSNIISSDSKLTGDCGNPSDYESRVSNPNRVHVTFVYGSQTNIAPQGLAYQPPYELEVLAVKEDELVASSVMPLTVNGLPG